MPVAVRGNLMQVYIYIYARGSQRVKTYLYRLIGHSDLTPSITPVLSTDNSCPGQ